MANPTTEALFLIKDVKPGSKNLNIVFIVLEIGKLLERERLMVSTRMCILKGAAVTLRLQITL